MNKSKLNLIKYFKLKREADVEFFEDIEKYPEAELLKGHDMCKEATEYVFKKHGGACSFNDLLKDGIPYLIDRFNDDADDDYVLHTILSYTKHLGVMGERQRSQFK